MYKGTQCLLQSSGRQKAGQSVDEQQDKVNKLLGKETRKALRVTSTFSLF